MSALMIIVWIVVSPQGIDPTGKPLGTDFISFYAASGLARAGHAANAYVPAQEAAAEQAIFPAAHVGATAFFYPPTFLLLCLPLALLPYFASLLVWMAVSLAALVPALRRMLPQRWAILPIFAFPGVLQTLGHGQNGCLSAACFGWGTLLMERRPLMAGACFGALIYKPHLAVAVPVCLVAARRWRVMGGAVLMSAVLLLASWLVLGPASWAGFARGMGVARQVLEQGLIPYGKFTSVFAAARLLGASVGIALLLQAVTALTVCAAAAIIAWRRPGGAAEGAVMVCASLLCTPFIYEYDLACLAVPLALTMADAQRTFWRRHEKQVLLAAYILPLVSRAVATLGLPVAPLVLLALFAAVGRRAQAVPLPA